MKLSWGWRSRLLIGLNVVLMALFALISVVLLNLIGSRRYIRFDLTTGGEYRLSPQTLLVLEGLKKSVRMYACFHAYGEIDRKALQRLLSMLSSYEYHARRGMLEVERVDVHRDIAKVRGLVEMLDVAGAGPGGILNTVVVTCEDRAMAVGIDEMVRYDLTGYMGFGEPAGIKEITAERPITNAIQNVLREKKVPVGFVSGHGEGDIDDYDPLSGYSEVALLLKQSGAEPQKFWLEGRHEIPKELKCLVVMGPRYDFLPEEIELIRRYLKNGGSLFLMLADGVEVKGLRGLLREFGVDIRTDVVFDEEMCYRDPWMPVVMERGFRRHPITSMLRGTRLIFEDASSLRLVGGRDFPYEVRPLFETTENSYARVVGEEEKLDVGPFVLAAAVSTKPHAHDASDGDEGRPVLVVVGDADFAQNGCISPQAALNFNPGNRLFLQSVFRWLLPEEAGINIEPVPWEERTVEILPRQLGVVFWVVMIAMPAAGIFTGILMWFVRRK